MVGSELFWLLAAGAVSEYLLALLLLLALRLLWGSSWRWWVVAGAVHLALALAIWASWRLAAGSAAALQAAEMYLH